MLVFPAWPRIEVNVPKSPPFWLPGVHAARRPYLLARGRIAAALRCWFAGRDFVEVETSVLQGSPGNETHLHAFATDLIGAGGDRRPLYLRTSPEFACKKLLTAGETRIVDFARVFRNRERGALHHPEFTLLEWYRANEPYESLMTDCISLLAAAAEVAETKEFSCRGRVADPFAAAERVTVADAFARFTGIDLLATISEHGVDRDRFAAELRGCGVRTASDDTWSDIFSRALVEKGEPNLGLGRPTILYEYPAIEAALARRKPSDARVA